MLVSVVEEVEHFPWGVVNNLTKTSPHMLQRVDIALRLLIDKDLARSITSQLSPEYEAYFGQVRSALPELDKKVIMSVASQGVCSFSQLFAGLTFMTNSSRIILMTEYVVQLEFEDKDTTDIFQSSCDDSYSKPDDAADDYSPESDHNDD